MPPQESGVYCIKFYEYFSQTSNVVYVGSSTNLFARYKSHELFKKLRQRNDGLYSFYWKEVKHAWYDTEISLIKKLRPKYNKQHNG